MKECRKCGRLLPLNQFALKQAATGTRQSQCRTCQNAYSRAHHQQNRLRFRAGNKANRVRYKVRARRHVQSYLEANPCVDCGERDTVVLEFDHVSGRKRMAVAALVYRGPSIASLDAEIAKCIVRCANCHRRKTLGDKHWRSCSITQSKVTHLVKTKSEPLGPASSMVEHPPFKRRVRGPIPRRGKVAPFTSSCVAHKICARCQVAKPLTGFCRLKRRGGVLDCYCLGCRRDYNKLYHQIFAAIHHTAVACYKRQRRARNARILMTYLGAHACVDCGESDARVLEFDHLNGTKLGDVAQLLAANWERIAAEIAKCEVRCANCHRRKTAKQFGWYANVRADRAWRGSNPQPPDSKSGTLSN